MALRVRHEGIDADASCPTYEQYLAVYAPAGWALVVEEDGALIETDGGVPTAHLGVAEQDGETAPIPEPVVDVPEAEAAPEPSPTSVPEPRPDPSDFVDFDATPTDPADGAPVESEED